MQLPMKKVTVGAASDVNVRVRAIYQVHNSRGQFKSVSVSYQAQGSPLVIVVGLKSRRCRKAEKRERSSRCSSLVPAACSYVATGQVTLTSPNEFTVINSSIICISVG